jgi:hypothetical protein
MGESAKRHSQSTILLDGHCIACAVNQRAHSLVVQMLECNDEAQIAELNEELDLLTRFREDTDFNRLQLKRPELNGDRPLMVIIREGFLGRFNLSVQAAGAASVKNERKQDECSDRRSRLGKAGAEG